MILQLWSVRDLSVTLVSIEIHLNTGLLCIPFIFHAWTSCHIEIRLWIRREANTCPGLVLSGDTGQLSHVVRTLVRMQSLWNCQWCYSSFFCKTRNITFVIPSWNFAQILYLIMRRFKKMLKWRDSIAPLRQCWYMPAGNLVLQVRLVYGPHPGYKVTSGLLTNWTRFLQQKAHKLKPRLLEKK